ncbi:MAG: ATP-dependent Clp protease adaptor ClpS [Verrucomicrobiota bacterium]
MSNSNIGRRVDYPARWGNGKLFWGTGGEPAVSDSPLVQFGVGCPSPSPARWPENEILGWLDNIEFFFYFSFMAGIATPEIAPAVVQATEDKPKSGLDPGYLVICWNDPVNYMQYVTHVFQVVFGWPRKKAEFHMLQVHEQGKSVLVRESMEKAEHYAHQLQKYSLHATMERDE